MPEGQIKAGVLAIGDELLAGLRINTDIALIANFLEKFGREIGEERTVRDEDEAIKSAVAELSERFPLVITTGGLGPTHDDRTRYAIADLLRKELIRKEELLEGIKKRLKELEMQYIPEIHDNYALVPQGFEPIPNKAGIAPGLFYHADGKTILLLPGPPREVKAVLQKIEPKFKELFGQSLVVKKTIRTFGIPEVDIQDKLKDVMEELGHVSLLPSPIGVDVVLKAIGKEEKKVREEIEKKAETVKHILGEDVYGEDDDTLEKVVGEILRRRRLRIGVAESCTGGLVSHLITNVPGSSDYFWGNVVAYDNKVKEEVLGVPSELIAHFGAVSEPVALMMAEGIRKLLHVEVGISTTGIAGPTGGTPKNPVGLVYMGISIMGRTKVFHKIFKADRLGVKEQSAYTLLDALRRELLKC